MSCIPKILELKGDKEFLPVDNGTVIEGGGHYNGYDYIVTFRDMGFRCNYVAISSEKDISQDEIYVHGWVTFFEKSHISKILFDNKVCDDKWLEFDAHHYVGLTCFVATKKYFKHINDDDMTNINLLNMFMVEQCKRIIDQLNAPTPGV